MTASVVKIYERIIPFPFSYLKYIELYSRIRLRVIRVDNCLCQHQLYLFLFVIVVGIEDSVVAACQLLSFKPV